MKKRVSTMLIVILFLLGLLSFQPSELDGYFGEIGYAVCIALAIDNAIFDCAGVPHPLWENCFSANFYSYSGQCNLVV